MAKKTITLYKVEVGVLLREDNSEWECYSQVYDKKHAYYDENTAFFLNSADAVEFALSYVTKGVENTYAIVKGMVCEKEYLTDEMLRDIKLHGVFDDWMVFFESENWDTKNIVLDLYKSGDKTIKYDFVDKHLI